MKRKKKVLKIIPPTQLESMKKVRKSLPPGANVTKVVQSKKAYKRKPKHQDELRPDS